MTNKKSESYLSTFDRRGLLCTMRVMWNLKYRGTTGEWVEFWHTGTVTHCQDVCFGVDCDPPSEEDNYGNYLYKHGSKKGTLLYSSIGVSVEVLSLIPYKQGSAIIPFENCTSDN